MKKRFISKLLMAALVVVTMGVFSSCKDYDDDINANTALINQLQTQVDALKTAAAKAQADATQALTNAATAQAAADNLHISRILPQEIIRQVDSSCLADLFLRHIHGATSDSGFRQRPGSLRNQ